MKGIVAVVIIFVLLTSAIVITVPFAGSQTTDDWPMFRHDANHSGYSTSTAPMTNQTTWINAIGASVTSPVITNGVVYVGSSDGVVYALNAATGTKLWNYVTGSTVSSSLAVVNGVVYVASNDGNLYALNAASGSKLWSYVTRGSFNSTSTGICNVDVF